MAKDGVLFPKSEDTRFRSRVLKTLRGILVPKNIPGQTPNAEARLNRWWASIITLVVWSVLGFGVLVNVISTDWLTYTQMMLVAIVAALFAAVWTFVFITRSRSLLKRGFYTGAMLTLVAIIGYTFSIRIKGLTKEPIDFTGGATPLEGWSILAAIVIVLLLFIGMLHESRNS
jgi:cation transport ATPase